MTYKDIEDKQKYMRRYRLEHKVELREYHDAYRRDHREALNSATRKWKHKVKVETLAYYSMKDYPVCASCGETDIRVLQIDHINGGGNEHRRQLGRSGYTLYVLLKRQNYPEGYQVLCANCNIRKWLEEGC